MKKMIDIMDIRNAEYLKFYVKNDFIYCENVATDEKVIVADLFTGDEEMEVIDERKITKDN